MNRINRSAARAYAVGPLTTWGTEVVMGLAP